MPNPHTITGPFSPYRDGANHIRMLADKSLATARITATVKRRMKEKAHDLGINIAFKTEEFAGKMCVAVLTEGVDHRRKPKKQQQRSFAERANCVMSFAGTIHNVPEPFADAA